MKPPRVLVACEESGAVRDALINRGIDAWSNDLEDVVPGGAWSAHHLYGDALTMIEAYGPWDALIAFPPCTYLASSGLHWNKRRPERAALTEQALAFVQRLLNAPVPRIALENPIGCISSRIRKPDQIIQPWMFGDDASKATCLWLKGLPLLRPTNVLRKARYANQTPSGQNKLGPSPERAVLRSKTYPGVAAAMADQWGAALL